uniref:Uncharacterized protein n=1 Tax=Anguilla anguilla TaxID=7936 RepID=A0A0E9PIW7_ANGAN
MAAPLANVHCTFIQVICIEMKLMLIGMAILVTKMNISV